MNWKGRLSTLGCLALLASPAAAQVYYPRAGAPGCLPPPVCPTPGVPPTTTTPPSTTIPPGQQGDAFAQAPEGGTAAADSYNPAMFGDQGFFSSFSSSSNSSSSNNRLATFAAVPLHATFKIAENESPVPVSRAYINYNYYNNVTHRDAAITASNLPPETFVLEPDDLPAVHRLLLPLGRLLRPRLLVGGGAERLPRRDLAVQRRRPRLLDVPRHRLREHAARRGADGRVARQHAAEPPRHGRPQPDRLSRRYRRLARRPRRVLALGPRRRRRDAAHRAEAVRLRRDRAPDLPLGTSRRPNKASARRTCRRAMG